jgi:hypothetical protein
VRGRLPAKGKRANHARSGCGYTWRDRNSRAPVPEFCGKMTENIGKCASKETRVFWFVRLDTDNQSLAGRFNHKLPFAAFM